MWTPTPTGTSEHRHRAAAPSTPRCTVRSAPCRTASPAPRFAPDVAKEATERLLDIVELLAAHQVSEADRHDGWRPDLAGRGHPLLPPYFIDEETDAALSGRVTFTRFYLGGNGAAHGGAHPLLFDDVLGRVMNHHQPSVARTAFLKVNYRQVTPLDVELRFEATRDRVDGRKRWGSARLFDASGALLSDAEGLFLQLLPGQA